MKKFYIIITSISYRKFALFITIFVIFAISFLFFNKNSLFGRSDMLHSSSCTSLSRLLSQKSGSLVSSGIYFNFNKAVASISPAPVRWLGHCDRRHWLVVQLFGGLGNQLYDQICDSYTSFIIKFFMLFYFVNSQIKKIVLVVSISWLNITYFPIKYIIYS